MKSQNVNGSQVGIHLYKAVRIEEALDSLTTRLRLMIVAPWTDTLILRQLGFGNYLSAPGAFLEKAARDFTFFAGLCFDCWFLENRHGIMHAPPLRRGLRLRQLLSGRGRIRSM